MNQNPPHSNPQPELLLCATLYLLSQTALNTACLGRACIVIEHLKQLESHPDTAPAVRAMAYQLCTHWLVHYEELAVQDAQLAGLGDGAPSHSCLLH